MCYCSDISGEAAFSYCLCIWNKLCSFKSVFLFYQIKFGKIELLLHCTVYSHLLFSAAFYSTCIIVMSHVKHFELSLPLFFLKAKSVSCVTLEKSNVFVTVNMN